MKAQWSQYWDATDNIIYFQHLNTQPQTINPADQEILYEVLKTY